MLNTLKKGFSSGSFDLLIKGKPGVGKTLFALTIIKDNIPGIYISTRVQLEELKNYVPWVSDLIKKKLLYDATFSQIPSSKKISNETKIETSRLSTFLEEVYRLITNFTSQENIKNNIVRPVCIIDSIDALKEHFDNKSYRIEKILLDISAKDRVNMVFITERENETNLDFLVDGIIELRMEFEEEHIIRKAIIKKIRGIEIKRPIHYYTITDNGIVFLEPMRSDIVSYDNLKFSKVTNTLKYSTGILELDNILDGGFIKGSSILVDVAPNVPIYIPAYFMDMVGLNMMHNNLPWYFMSSFQATGETFENWLKKSFPKNMIEKYFRPIYICKASKNLENHEQESKYEFCIKKSEVSDKSLAKVIEEDIKKNEFKTAYASFALDSLEAQLGQGIIYKVVTEMDVYLRKIKGLVSYFTFTNQKDSSKVPWANYYLKFRNKGGLGLLSIEKPIKEGFFVVQFDWNLRGSKIKLIKIK